MNALGKGLAKVHEVGKLARLRYPGIIGDNPMNDRVFIREVYRNYRENPEDDSIGIDVEFVFCGRWGKSRLSISWELYQDAAIDFLGIISELVRDAVLADIGSKQQFVEESVNQTVSQKNSYSQYSQAVDNTMKQLPEDKLKLYW